MKSDLLNSFLTIRYKISFFVVYTIIKTNCQLKPDIYSIYTRTNRSYVKKKMVTDKTNASSSSLVDTPADETEVQPPINRRPTFLDRLMRRQTSPSSMEYSESDKKKDGPMENEQSKGVRESSLPPLSQLSLKGYKSSTKRRLLDDELASNIRNLLPARLQLFDEWDLVYSLEQHGVSLNTLYQRSNPDYQLLQLRKNKPEVGYGDSVISSMMSGNVNSMRERRRPQGYVLIIKDENNSKFGCFVNEHLRPMDQKRYYGNGECFLWKSELFTPSPSNSNSEEDISSHLATPQIRFKAFMYTGINDNIIYSNHDFIAIGSSKGQNGLWIDRSLYNGVSYSCDTFGNEILNSNSGDAKIGKFKIMGLELWRVGTLE